MRHHTQDDAVAVQLERDRTALRAMDRTPTAFRLGQLRRMSPTGIILLVAQRFHLSSDDLRGADRHKDIALGRHIAMYLIRLALGLSFPRIGRIFNRRDHSSVISAVRKIEAQRFTCAEVRTQLAALVLLDEASGPMSSSALADGAC
jgi:chromosomal replication initiation ATPase DnaA